MVNELKINGPWSVTYNNWEQSTVYDELGDIVCEVPISNDVTEETQEHFEKIAEATACAIAALPELIEAAKPIAAILGEMAEHSQAHAAAVMIDIELVRALRAALRAALNKVREGSNG